jgi:O-antigen/teichoic acid export membrane protein
MSSAAKAIAWHGLKRRALSLGAMKAFDNAMQFLLPVVLVRALDSATFGEYRLLWLAVATVMGLATLNIYGSLYFFVPRSDAEHKRLYIHQAMAWLLAAGLVCAVAVSAWNPWLPAPMIALEKYGALVPAFVALWVATILLDHLPTIEERIGWQAWVTLGLSALRVLAIAAAAWFTGDMLVILWLLLGVVVVKLALLIAYVRRFHGFARPWFRRQTAIEQFKQSAPYGASSALFSLRGQADQWVAASLFALSSFAAFSIAALVGQVVQLIRQSVIEAFLPSMSRLEAAGDHRGMMEMNSRANVMVGMLLYPLLAFAFAFAEDILTVVYTAQYAEGASAMRVYICGMAAMVIEMGSIVLLLREGGFAMRVAAVVLAISVATSWAGAHHFGLAGAAMGSVLAVYVDRAFMLRRVSRRTGIPLREMQHWRELAWTLVSAASAAALAWIVVAHFASHEKIILRLIIGGTVLGLSYLVLNFRSLRR